MTRTLLSTLTAAILSLAAATTQDSSRFAVTRLAAQQTSPATASATQQAPAPTPTALRNEKDSIKFAVIGDTGTGGSAQYEVARLLANAHSRFAYDFVIMLGDNMYGGEDPSDFVKKFEKPYQPLLDGGVKFYATLGNHDEPAQRFYKPFNMDGKRYYTFEKGDAEFFVLDSTYMTPAQVDWLKDELAKSNAHWKISYFHHPLYSSGEKHGSEEDLRALVEPLFVQYGVDVVFAGHEHFYERVKPQKGIYYFTAGGSAKLRAGNIANRSALTAKGFDTDNSFMLVELTKDRLLFDTISRKGQLVDSGALPHRPAEATSQGKTAAAVPAR